MIPFPTNPRAENFLAQIDIYNKQQRQDQANLKAHDEYVNLAQSWLVANQQNSDLGLPLTPLPLMPLKIIWNDDGSSVITPFADLKVPELRAKGTTASSGKMTSLPTPDRSDAILAYQEQLMMKLVKIEVMLEVIYQKS